MIEGLMNTLDEGLSHARTQLMQLRYEEALVLFTDSMEAIVAVEKSLVIIENEVGVNSIDVLAENLRSSMTQVLESYERKEESKIESHIMDEVMYNFMKWREVIECILINARLN